MSQPVKTGTLQPRGVVLALTMVACTVTGALYGANAKTRHQRKAEVETTYEATAADKIAALEVSRSRLVSRKKMVDEKIEKIRERQASRPQTQQSPQQSEKS